jgi:hypothetical protein
VYRPGLRCGRLVEVAEGSPGVEQDVGYGVIARAFVVAK